MNIIQICNLLTEAEHRKHHMSDADKAVIARVNAKIEGTNTVVITEEDIKELNAISRGFAAEDRGE